MDEQPDIFDLGLQADLAMQAQSPLTRRQALKLGAAGLAAFLASCAAPELTATLSPTGAATLAPSPTDAPSTQAGTASPSAAADECVQPIPPETAGPFPADGSNASNQRLNALALSGIVREDLRTSLGTGNTADGVPFHMRLQLVDTNNGCAPLAGYALYAWHCDRVGSYSMYSAAAVAEDYCRGVQVADADGVVQFTSIFPACYPGRWPHVHFEVYPSLALATGAEHIVHTSQLAIPKSACDAVYATAGYETSVASLSQLSLETDGVFRDGVAQQLASMSGDAASGYTATLTVGIAA